jgi:Fe-S-cluster containining protein
VGALQLSRSARRGSRATSGSSSRGSGNRSQAAGRATATYNLRIPTIDGHSTVQVQVPRGPMRLRDLVPLAQRITMIHVEKAIEMEKSQGSEISCKRGCAACCRQLVPISAPEAFRLADHVLALDDRTREGYLARIDAAESAIAAAGLMAELETIAGGGAVTDVKGLAARYFGAWIDCPFLHEESCTVHAERPLVCRDYMVTTPAELCSDLARKKVRTVPMPPVLSPLLGRAAASLTGGAPVMIPLGVAMRWVDAHADWGFQEWPGLEVLGALLRELGIPAADLAAAQA